jgi:hypothetical protein
MNQFFIRRGFRSIASRQMPLPLIFAYWIKFQFCKLALLPFSFVGHWGGRFTIDPDHLAEAEFIVE